MSNLDRGLSTDDSLLAVVSIFKECGLIEDFNIDEKVGFKSCNVNLTVKLTCKCRDFLSCSCVHKMTGSLCRQLDHKKLISCRGFD